MDYVYVKQAHRASNPQLLDYMNLSKYLRMMLDMHGLAHDPLAPLDIPLNYHCFKVIDKGKAMLFCLVNGDQILKPEINSKNNF
jgi:hypothetical protein